jgi:NADPH-dependent 2,4-dienoyl-CoA reductase/sulfur reductase-like enzyme/nitrite reductase/ring-hydroxylating ferredoxin subunit
MGAEQSPPSGPDLAAGIASGELADGAMLLGHVGEEAVLLARRGEEIFAVGATCTHYGGPLAEGLLVDDTVRCPWHHACFSLRTGEAIRAPALNPIACWKVERRDGRIVVGERIEQPSHQRRATAAAPRRIVILGGGAAGIAAARMLRQEGYDGAITMLSADSAAPYDRPNLSKDFLAGTAQEDWIPLFPPEFYAENRIELILDTRATAIDPAAKRVALAGGSSHEFDALLIATGAEPVRLSIPGADLPHVHLLRSLADSRAIIAAAQSARRAVVIGASFIGLEVAASLRTRGLEVHVVAPEARPMERVFGPELGDFIRNLHQEHGVTFHLGQQTKSIDARQVMLQSGEKVDADLVVVGIGVRPVTELAERAGLATDRGVTVNEYLETSAPGIFAAGDLARWPDPHSGEAIRVEHWVVAERQGQTAARNMLGQRERFDAVPFFWSQHYDVAISYIGHAEHWDATEIDGDMGAHDCAVRFRRGGKLLALATIFRDHESLATELAMERAVSAGADAKR